MRGGVATLALCCGMIVASGLAAHGVILLTDYRLWDSWEFTLWLQDPSQLPYLRHLFTDIGRPLDMVYWYPLVGVDKPYLVSKWLGVAAWIAAAVFMYRCMNCSGVLRGRPALMTSLLTVVCPVFRPLGELIMWMNTAAVCLFWAAWWIRCAGGRLGAPVVRAGFRLVSVGLFFLSFNLNSLLVFQYAVFVVSAWVLWRSFGKEGIAVSFRNSVMNHWDVLVLPVVFWVWKSVFTPTGGPYVNYNKPQLDPAAWAMGYAAMAQDMVWPLILQFWDMRAWLPVVLFAAWVFATLMVKWRGVAACLSAEKHESRDGVLLLGGGVVLLAAAAFPYLAVGQPLSKHAWLARNAILCPLPLSLVAVGVAEYVSRRMFPSRLMTPWFIAGTFLLAWIVAANISALQLQGQGVKQEALRRVMQDVVRDKQPCVIQLIDFYMLPDTISYYPPLIWTTMAAQRMHEPATFVFDIGPLLHAHFGLMEQTRQGMQRPYLQLTPDIVRGAIEQTTTPYALTAIPLSGPQCQLCVHPGVLGTDAMRIGIEYLRVKYAGGSSVEEFQNKSVTCEVVDLPPVR